MSTKKNGAGETKIEKKILYPCILKKECVLYPADREKYPHGIKYPCHTLGMRTDNKVTFGIPEKLEYKQNDMILEDIPGTIDTSYGIMMSPTKENLSIWRETNEQNVASWEICGKGMIWTPVLRR